MRDLWERDELRVEYIKTDLNKTDICTMNLPFILHASHQHAIWNGELKLMNRYNQLSIPKILTENSTCTQEVLNLNEEKSTDHSATKCPFQSMNPSINNHLNSKSFKTDHNQNPSSQEEYLISTLKSHVQRIGSDSNYPNPRPDPPPHYAFSISHKDPGDIEQDNDDEATDGNKNQGAQHVKQIDPEPAIEDFLQTLMVLNDLYQDKSDFNDSKQDNWNDNDSDDHNLLIQNQIQAQLALQNQQVKQTQNQNDQQSQNDQEEHDTPPNEDTDSNAYIGTLVNFLTLKS